MAKPRTLAQRTQAVHDRLTHFYEDARKGAEQLGGSERMRAYFGAQQEAYSEGMLALEAVGAAKWQRGTGQAPSMREEVGRLGERSAADLRATLGQLARDFAALAAAERANAGSAESQAIDQLHDGAAYASVNIQSFHASYARNMQGTPRVNMSSGTAEATPAPDGTPAPRDPEAHLTPAERDYLDALTHDLARTRAHIYQYIADRLGVLSGAGRTPTLAEIPPTNVLMRGAE